MGQETEICPTTPLPLLPSFFFISELLSSSQDGLGAGGLVGGGGQGGEEEAGRGLGQAHRPRRHITSHNWNLLQVPLHHINVLLQVPLQHLLQVSLQHITATFSCPRGKKKCTGGGQLSMGLPCLVPSSCLSPYVPGFAPRPGHWPPGHWTLDTRHPSPTPGPRPIETTCLSSQGPDSFLQG